jgi:hypothetical protein
MVTVNLQIHNRCNRCCRHSGCCGYTIPVTGAVECVGHFYASISVSYAVESWNEVINDNDY